MAQTVAESGRLDRFSAAISHLFERTSGERHTRREARAFKVLAVLSIIALILQTGMLFLALFEPGLPYRVVDGGTDIASDHFLESLTALTGGHADRTSRFQVLTNGEAFYPAELAAIRQSRQFVHIECYIFDEGEVTAGFLDTLIERAGAGVEVRLLIDAIGSAGYLDLKFRKLRDAGGHVAWYHPVRWHTWPRINNRTHRELIVVDGKTGFFGGAGFADHWLRGKKREPRWRDTMVRVDGGAVAGLQATFAENWLEATGDILIGARFLPAPAGPGAVTSLVGASSPTTGRSSQARMLLQPLLATARSSIHVTNPYFLPDKGLVREIERAVRERGVEVKIVVPGKRNDHLLTRRSSRRLYGDVLKAGARIFEYEPAMIHAKTMVIDGLWALAGSVNLDSRSFSLNDELSVAMRDPALAARFEADFQRDLAQSREITYEHWKKRPVWEVVQEIAGALLERQQ